MVPPGNGILFNSEKKKKRLSSNEYTWKMLKYILVNERHQSEEVTYCMIPILRHSGKENYGHNKKISV